MIVNSITMNHTAAAQMDSFHQSDSFYLKRKLDSSTAAEDGSFDCDATASFAQSKKRHIIQNICSDFNETREVQYNLNNNGYTNGVCQQIEFLSYDNNLAPINQTATVYCNDQFDNAWQNTDLLELDHRYNSAAAAAAATTTTIVSETIPNNITPEDQQQQLSETIPRANSNSSQTDSDFEDKNLSWLFNFKLEELPHLSPEVNRSNNLTSSSAAGIKPNKTTQSKTGKKVDELIMEITSEIEDSEIIVGENVVIENTPKMPKKPPFTYTELIEYALEDKRELTVSGIYQWISDRFPYYKSNDDRWKNSVRHNLSINPHFRKGVKAPQGAGHLWTISSRDSEENALAWEHKKQRLELFFKMEMSQKRNATSPPQNNCYDEAATAAESIVQQLRNESVSPEQNNSLCHSPILNNENISPTSTTDPLEIIHEEDLKKAAGEILNGIRRNVEVQSIHSTTISTYHDNLVETGDYLNPINKDDAIIESGLSSNRSEIGNEYYVTDIDPIELGINMSNVEEQVLFSEEFNLNYFGITSGNDIMA